MANRFVTVWGPWRLGRPAVIVHGGAGGWKGLAGFNEVQEAVARAAERGISQENIADMLVSAIKALEDSGVLNAGVGSVLTIDGRVEMDAGLMFDDMRAGGVGAVTYPRNPILLAKWVATNTPHALIVGKEADRIAEKLGLERHPGPSKRVLEAWRSVIEKIRAGETINKRAETIYQLYFGGDTVGAVALDRDGGLAAGASTGGVAFKHPGRVGDSPIPGAGFYVERGIGGCSATGIGETIILGRPCIHALALLRDGVPVVEAARAAVARHTAIFGPDNLGIILLTADGQAAAAMNTAAMPVAIGGRDYRASEVLQRREAEK